MAKRALIIGAAGGIGLETARLFIDAGWAVVATVRNEAERQVVRSEASGCAAIVEIDMASAEQVRDRLCASLKEGEALDAVVVCTGINPNGPLELADLSEARATFEVNALSCLAVYQATMPALRAARGALVLISSMSGRVAMPFIGVYSASKHALEGLADVMRREAYPWGVRVVLIEPGGVKTPLGPNQIPGVKARRAALTGAHSAHYGDFFDAYVTRLETNLPKGVAPSAVAQVIAGVIDDPAPAARYAVGADAERLCDAARNASDLEIDEQFRTSYGAPLNRRD